MNARNEFIKQTAKVIKQGKGTLDKDARKFLQEQAKGIAISHSKVNDIIREQLEAYYNTCPQCGIVCENLSLVCSGCGYIDKEATGKQTIDKDIKELQRLLVEIKAFHQPSTARRIVTALFHIFTFGYFKIMREDIGRSSKKQKRETGFKSLEKRSRKLSEKMDKLYGDDAMVGNLLDDLNFETDKAVASYRRQGRQAALVSSVAVAAIIIALLLPYVGYSLNTRKTGKEIEALLSDGNREAALQKALSITTIHDRRTALNVIAHNDARTFIKNEEWEKAVAAASLISNGIRREGLIDEIYQRSIDELRENRRYDDALYYAIRMNDHKQSDKLIDALLSEKIKALVETGKVEEAKKLYPLIIDNRLEKNIVEALE
ncbi:hypothetical protein [Petrimonas mucosa]|uniref:hypothetical protein n=1 Tax=Petrimonas mucosa TaxID=1642646 RepID=UPI00177314C3|nr:hypothetical protein [Petrimonas mucosa]HHT28995.1 hypothetical protein [Petrimonas mucosa]